MQQPWHALASYGFHHELQPQLLDVNPGRHVGNISLIRMLAEARFQYRVQKIGGPRFASLADDCMLRPAAVTTDFLNLAFYPEPIIAGVALTAADKDGFCLVTGLFQGKHCVAVQNAVIGAWRTGDGMERLPLPEAMQERLQLRGASDASLTAKSETIAPGAFPCRLRVTARYGDLDADGCFSEGALAELADSARSTLVTAMFRQAGHDFRSSGFGTLAASVRNQFPMHRPVRGELDIEAGIRRVGNSSFDIRIAIFHAGSCLAVSDHVMVCTSRATDRPTPIPADVRALFEQSLRASTMLGAGQ
jgi:acyl-CoA thioesterase FadM